MLDIDHREHQDRLEANTPRGCGLHPGAPFLPSGSPLRHHLPQVVVGKASVSIQLTPRSGESHLCS